MVSLDDLRAGDVVKIVDQWCHECYENPDGEMDHWLGELMTVSEVYDEYVRMVEDDGEFCGDGWDWFPNAIEGIVCSIDDEEMEEIDASDLLSAIETMRKVDIWI